MKDKDEMLLDEMLSDEKTGRRHKNETKKTGFRRTDAPTQTLLSDRKRFLQGTLTEGDDGSVLLTSSKR